ncbi:MAG: beta-lactamase family protein, partial [Acidobacteria bacterium]|nr:beta-lactamase family protein [Acidobacteriota bacterium]
MVRTLVLLFLFAAALAAQPSAISERMKWFVDHGSNVGIVTLLQHKGKQVHLNAAGYADLEKKKPMRADTMFQIMSMTKPFAGTAIMMLQEEGKLYLSDPVEKHLPEFRGQMTIDTRDGDRITLKKPSRP